MVATIANAQGPPAYRLNGAIIDALSPTFAARRRAHPLPDDAPVSGDIAPFIGRWTGSVTTSQRELDVEIEIVSPEQARLRINGEPEALARVAVAGGVLTARTATVQLSSAETTIWPHQLRLTIELQDGRLKGAIAAYAAKDPAPHDQFWLSHEISISKTPARR